MHHEIYQTQSLSVTCSLRFAYPVGTATMFSQAQSVHASRDLSNAVMIRIPCRHRNYVFASPVGTCITRFIKRSHDSHTLSALQLCFRKPSRYMHLEIYHTQSLSVTYLLSMIRLPCRHLHLKFCKPSRYMHLKYFRKPMQSVHASREYQTQSLFTCISLIRIPCVCFACHVGTASI